MSSEEDTQDKWGYTLEQVASKKIRNFKQCDHATAARDKDCGARSKTKSKSPPSLFERTKFYWWIKNKNKLELVENVKIIKPKLDMYIS